MTETTNKLHKYSKYWMFVLLATLGVGLILGCLKEFRIPNLLNLQFSQDLGIFNKEIPRDSSLVVDHILMDGLFIVIYTLLFYCSLKVFRHSLKMKFPLWVYAIAFIPGIFDLVENILFYQLSIDPDNVRAFQWFFWSVRIKWLFIVILGMVVLAILAYYLLLYVGKLINLLRK